MKKLKTSKPVKKIIKRGSYVDPETAEEVPCYSIEMEEADINFEKIWLGHIMQALDCVGNKKIKVMNFMLENRNSKNQVIATQRIISQKLNVSLPVVSETLKLMQEADIITMEQQGVYLMNPDVIFKGKNKTRMDVLLKYKKLASEDE